MSEQTKTAFLGDLGEYLFAWHLRSNYGIETAIYKGDASTVFASIEKESYCSKTGI